MSLPIERYLETASDGSIINKAFSMTMYIPKYYFENEIAIWNGGEVASMGVFYVGFKATETSEEELMRMNVSVTIKFNYSDQTIVEVDLAETGIDFYYALTLFKDEVFMGSTTHLVSLEDAKKYLSFLNQGKLPSDIPYDKVLDTVKYNLYTNDLGVPVPSALLELMIGEMCRYKKDVAVPFRRVAGRTGDLTGYEMVNIKTLPRINSVFGGLAFENINESIVTGIKMTKEKRPQNISNGVTKL